MAQESKVPAQTRPRNLAYAEWRPLEDIRRQIDRMFEDFWRFPQMQSPALSPSNAGPMMGMMGMPAVDLDETPDAFKITAELPGMDEKNIEVKCSGDVLTIRGEKKDEREEEKEGHYLSERQFGSFQRSFRIPDNVDPQNIEATFKNGVLTLTLPKTKESQQSEKKISVKAG